MLWCFICSLSTVVWEAGIVRHLDWPGKQAARRPLGAPGMDRRGGGGGSSPLFARRPWTPTARLPCWGGMWLPQCLPLRALYCDSSVTPPNSLN